MLRVARITDKKVWNEFVKNLRYSLMTQAWEYGEFYESFGENFFVIGCYDGTRLVGGALIVTVHAKRGKHLYVPYGPVAIDSEYYLQVLACTKEYLVKQAKKENYPFIRISPFVIEDETSKKWFSDLHFQNAPLHALAETTCLLDISKEEEILIKEMNKNHRNLIRRCEKEGVIVQVSTSHKDLKKFHELHEITAKRHKFTRFSDSYIEKEFSAFEKKAEACVIFAYLPDGTLDSSAVVYFWGSMAAYRHGASLGMNHKIPTPYIIQWTAIKEAKKRGCLWYNFWGVAPEKAKNNHPFKGITHFKKGFGGEILDLVPCQDFVLQPIRYALVRCVESLRKKIRGF